MTLRKVPTITNEYYHVFNKSIGDLKIFDQLHSLNKILEIVNFYRFNQKIKLSRFHALNNEMRGNYLKGIKTTQPLIDIFCFSFMPNHYHFLVRQLQENGIRKFMSNIQNSYAKYFDLKNNRQGSLFLSTFKYKKIINEEQYKHTCRYIHLNSVTSHLIEFDQLISYPYSSYSRYLSKKDNDFVNVDFILNQFKSKENFIKFHQNQVDYQRKLKVIKDLLFD